MNVKYYTGRSLAEAIGRAKRDYGSDIILLDSKEIRNEMDGSKLVQVSVSVDEKEKKGRVKSWRPPTVSSQKEVLPPKKEVETKEDFNQVISNILARRPKTLNQEKQILQELAALKEQVSQLKIKTTDEVAKLPENFERIRENLIAKGIKPSMADGLIKKAYYFSPAGAQASSAEIIHTVKNELRTKIKFYDLDRIAESSQRQVIMLVGPTGVGKTTMVMKLAAHPKILAQKEVAIISTDPYGPSEALKAFSRMSGVPVIEKKREDELAEVMHRLNDYEVVLVDVAGSSPFAANFMKKMEEYVKIIKPDQIFLVAAMNTDVEDFFASASLYLLLKPSGLILTKFDETNRWGKFFTLMEELELPVVAFGEGKRIFIDIVLPDEHYIFKKLFEDRA